MRASQQLDVIVYDAMSSAMIASAADGTGYYPYESILAVGEVKTTYRRSEHPIEAFAQKLRQLRSLDRERPPGRTSALIRHGYGSGITLPISWPYFNPMFSFMVCLESDEFDDIEFARVAAAVSREDRPSLVALLDRGIVAFVTRPEPGTVLFDWWPEFPVDPDVSEVPTWEGLKVAPDTSHASALAMLYHGMGAHLAWAAVKSPEMERYLPAVRSWPMWRETSPAP